MLKRFADYLGLSASTLCLLHCLAVPVLFAVFSVSLSSAQGWLEYIFVGLMLLAVGLTFMRRVSGRVRLLLQLGAVLFIASLFIPEPVTGFNVAHIPACLLIGTGHWFNLRTAKAGHTSQVAQHSNLATAEGNLVPATQAA